MTLGMPQARNSSDGSYVVVIGSGSIGRRHASNLVKLGADVGVVSGRVEQRKYWATQLPENRIFATEAKALASSPDAVVIANVTSRHLDSAIAAAERGCALFIEKPLSNCADKVRSLSDLAESRGLVVEIGCMLRLHPNLLFIHQFLRDLGEPIYTVRACVGQYLPDWRPDRDHRSSYSAISEQGGGAIFDLIHELDLVHWLVGQADLVAASAIPGDMLNICTEAAAQILLRIGPATIAAIQLDYLRPRLNRTLEIVGSFGQLEWDYETAAVSLVDRVHGVRRIHQVPNFERNDMFIDHMKHFLARVSDPNIPPVVSLQDGIAVLSIALAAHRSLAEGCFVRPAIDEGAR